MGWLEDANKYYMEFLQREENKKHCLVMESAESPSDFEGITSLTITGGCTWEQVADMELKGIKRLVFSLKGAQGDKKINAPDLLQLCIYGEAGIGYADLLDNPTSHVDFSGMPFLEKLELRHLQLIYPEDFSGLARLTGLTLVGADVSSLHWLGEAAYSLRELYVDSDVEELKGLESQQELETLRIYSAVIKDYSPITALKKLKNLDLRYSDIEHEQELKAMPLDCILAAGQDKDENGIDSEVREMIKTAVALHGPAYSRKKSPPSFETEVISWIRASYEAKLKAIASRDRFDNNELFKDAYIERFKAKAKEYCDFL